jgi:thioredoxin reductase/ferredoxin
MGIHTHFKTYVSSLNEILEKGYDAVFVGTGAPRGRNLDLPGREEAGKNVHIGIEWLASVAFEHTHKIGKKVIVLGGGNTAMDCCRTSRRLGGTNTHVIARRGRQFFKASPWELEDAEEEGIHIIENHAPKRFVMENGKLVGMEFERLAWSEVNGRQTSTVIDTVIMPCDTVILAIGQDNAFPWIERDIGITFDQWDMPVVNKASFQSSRPDVFFGGDAAWGPQNIIWAVEHGHQAAISIHKHCLGEDVTNRPAHGMHLSSTKMGMHAWMYSNEFNPSPRAQMSHAELVKRFASVSEEVELGYTPEQTATEVQRCLNCDIEKHFTAKLCIECDACIDVCPVNCLTIAPVADTEAELRTRLKAPAENLTQDLYLSEALPQTQRIMVKDEDICLHCGLCAERCPTAAWDMQKFSLVLPYAFSASGTVVPVNV